MKRKFLQIAAALGLAGFIVWLLFLRGLAPRALVSGQVRTNSIGMELVAIPAGEYQMGEQQPGIVSPEYESSHKVRITRPFEMGKFEVTRGEFAQFVAEVGYVTGNERLSGIGWVQSKRAFGWEDGKNFSWRDPGFKQTDAHPAVHITWDDANAFCKWLSKKEGLRYRLPTEAEWEYACRASTSTAFWNGNEADEVVQIGNVLDQTALTVIPYKNQSLLGPPCAGTDGFVFTAPVGSFPANAFGLHDMHGNADEWCRDWYSNDFYQGASVNDPVNDGSNWLNPIPRRITRGGNFNLPPKYCRSASRGGSSPKGDPLSGYTVGFRVVCEP